LKAGAIHQLIPSLASRDAIGAHTLQVQSVLREMGFSSEIFAGDVHPELSDRAQPYRKLPRHRGGRSWLLYQASIGSPVADFFADRPEPKLVNFHNITPARLLEGWEPHVAEEVATGRRQLARMAGKVHFAIAVSGYNRRDLLEAGFGRTEVVPPLVDLEQLDREVDERALGELMERKETEGGPDLLFVGKILPHKAQHDVVKVLAAYRAMYDGRARLHLVGGVASRSYQRAIEQFVQELGLEDAIELTGSVTPARLAAHYRAADAFVCCSDHEGFCFPLLEAMQHRLPVVAYGAAAVPETVGQAGLVMQDKSPMGMAAAVHRVVEDEGLREVLADAGQARLGDFSLERSRARFASVIQEAVGVGR
jgi:glycosyltransferase involved in cell wall biosynthesis